jgi:hypothetical protein
VGFDGRLVGVRYGADDGEAHSVSAAVIGAAGVQSLEWLEKPVELVWWNDRTGVGDAQHGAVAFDLGNDLYGSAGEVVGDGVVQQVGDETFDEPGVPVKRGGPD